MPYYVVKEGEKFCVHKGLKGQDEGKVPGGCHDTSEEANSHMRALYRNVKDAALLADANSSGMMVAVYLPSDLAAELAIDGGLEAADLHVTLGYMGNTEEDGAPDESTVAGVKESLANVSAAHPSLSGHIGGLGRFPEGDDGRPVWVPVDVVGLDALRVDVVRALQSAGLPARTDHGFAPHITLAYETDSPYELEAIEPRDVTFDAFYLKIGKETFEFPLSRQEAELDPIQAAADDIAAQETTRFGIRLYFQEGEQTSDRRVIDPNATNFNRPPPLPVRLQLQSGQGGHDNAVVAGVINKTFRDGLTIVSEGPLESGSVGQEVVRLAQEGILQTWSPDLGDETVDLEETETGTELVHFVQATLLGGTIVAMPALSSAVFEIYDYETGEIVVPAPTRQPDETDDSDETARPERMLATVGFASNITINSGQTLEETARKVRDSLELGVGGTTFNGVSVVACGGPPNPPSSWFENPELPELQRFVSITDDGRVYGHLAGWGECHIGYQDRCVMTPSSKSGYPYFHVGQVKTAEGTLIATGILAVKGGHAPRGLSANQAQAHYDNTETALADVVLYEDEFGIAYSGALRPTATEEQVRIFRASGVSGDWRRIESSLELIGACCVNIPGFPKVKIRLAASALTDEPEILALVAAGGPPLPDPTLSGCNCDHRDFEERIDYLEALISAAGIEDLAMERLTASFESTS